MTLLNAVSSRSIHITHKSTFTSRSLFRRAANHHCRSRLEWLNHTGFIANREIRNSTAIRESWMNIGSHGVHIHTSRHLHLRFTTRRLLPVNNQKNTDGLCKSRHLARHSKWHYSRLSSRYFLLRFNLKIRLVARRPGRSLGAGDSFKRWEPSDCRFVISQIISFSGARSHVERSSHSPKGHSS